MINFDYEDEEKARDVKLFKSEYVGIGGLKGAFRKASIISSSKTYPVTHNVNGAI